MPRNAPAPPSSRLTSPGSTSIPELRLPAKTSRPIAKDLPSISTSRNAASRLRSLYQQLLAVYGPQHWWPSRSPFETILGAYLVQNTSWRGVVRSIANLEAADALTPSGLLALETETLRQLIRPSGYMLRKAAAILAFTHFLDQHYNRSLDQLAAQPTAPLREQLLALPGVGPETADVILLYALGHPVMVVDEYLRRIATRHALALPGARYTDLQQLALSAFASDPPATLLQHFNEFHALIVEAGKNHCGPTPRCTDCPLRTFLPSSNPLPAR